MSRDDIAAIVTAIGDLVRMIQETDPADKAEIYARLGLTLTYQPERRLVEATVKPGPDMRKGFVSEAHQHQKPMSRDSRVRAEQRWCSMTPLTSCHG